MPTATTEVTFGSSIVIRKPVLSRSSALLRTFASTSASNSWGNVESSQMEIVLMDAFQNRGSLHSRK